MNLIFIIMIILITLVSFSIVIYLTKRSKYQFLLLKLDEAENNIDILLEKRLELFKRAIPIIKDSQKKYKDSNILSDVFKLQQTKVNNFELNNTLNTIKKEFIELIELNKDLSELDKLSKIRFEMIDVENELIASIKYYNNNADQYNGLLKKFSSNIVGSILKYKNKNLYEVVEEELFEIMKKK